MILSFIVNKLRQNCQNWFETEQWQKCRILFVLKNRIMLTGLCSILSPWKNWFHCHWKKKQIDCCTQSKPSMEKIPPDIEKKQRKVEVTNMPNADLENFMTCQLLDLNLALIYRGHFREAKERIKCIR
jgi:hypothetical protein